MLWKFILNNERFTTPAIYELLIDIMTLLNKQRIFWIFYACMISERQLPFKGVSLGLQYEHTNTYLWIKF